MLISYIFILATEGIFSTLAQDRIFASIEIKKTRSCPNKSPYVLVVTLELFVVVVLCLCVSNDKWYFFGKQLMLWWVRGM